MNNIWSDDFKEFKVQIIPLLQIHGKQIGVKSKDGNELCKRIIEKYSLLYKSFNPMIYHFVKEDLNTYVNEQELK